MGRGCGEVRVRSGHQDKTGIAPLHALGSPHLVASLRWAGGISSRGEGLRRATSREEEEEEDPLLRGFPDASSSAGAPDARPQLRGEGEGSGPARRQLGLERGGLRGAGRCWRGRRAARARGRGVCAPGPSPHPSLHGLRLPRAGVWIRSRQRVAAPGTWRPTASHPPARNVLTAPCSSPSLLGCRREEPRVSSPARGAALARLELRRLPREPSRQRGTGGGARERRKRELRGAAAAAARGPEMAAERGARRLLSTSSFWLCCLLLLGCRAPGVAAARSGSPPQSPGKRRAEAGWGWEQGRRTGCGCGCGCGVFV